MKFLKKNKHQDNIIVTPKIAGTTLEARMKTEKLLINKIIKKKFKMKNIWAIVTARRNSKSIKRKNIVKLGNKKIIEYSFDVLDKIRKKRQIQK